MATDALAPCADDAAMNVAAQPEVSVDREKLQPELSSTDHSTTSQMEDAMPPARVAAEDDHDLDHSEEHGELEVLKMSVRSPQGTDSNSVTEEQEDENENENEEEEELGDLGTPALTTPAGEEADDLQTHCFIGPSIAGNDRSARELHGTRTLCLDKKCPKFSSHVAAHAAPSPQASESGASSQATSSNSNASSGEPLPRSDSTDNDPNTYSVSFSSEEGLGFHVAVAPATAEHEVAVIQVVSVEQNSVAEQAGVGVGDAIVSVNGEHIDGRMSEDDLLQIAGDKSIVFARCNSVDSTSSGSGSTKRRGIRRASLPVSLTSAFSKGTSMLGSALKRKKAVVHKAIMCDGCGVDPVVGCLWTCSVCPSFHLCNECYELGTHGLEDTDEMRLLQEALVERKLLKKCKRYTPDFLQSLRHDVCKNRLDKFEYLGLWIADIVNPTPAHKIAVRGIEIPQLRASARQNFVSHLMPLASNRRDIEVNIEWFPDDTDDQDRPSVDVEPEEVGSSDDDNLEKLRIWISDKKKRTASPFSS